MAPTRKALVPEPSATRGPPTALQTLPLGLIPVPPFGLPKIDGYMQECPLDRYERVTR